MRHLCYVYINDYKCLKDVEIIIDSRYDYKFDRKSRTVDITDKKGYPAGFWSENIYSLTGIVGNNGAGKSTVMEFLLANLIEGSPYESKGDIFIYKDDRGLYYIGDNITVMYNDKVIGPQEDSYKKITVFYYSGHFTPSFMDNPLTSELSGSYIASDNVRIVKDLEGYYNEPSISMTLPLNRYFYSHIARNHYRICAMLADRKLSSLIKEFVWPKSVHIAINKSGSDAMTQSILGHNRLADQTGWAKTNVVIPEDLVSVKINCPKERFLTQMIYHNLLNLTYDLWGGWQNGFDTINKWQSYVKDGPVMERFKMFIETVDHDKQGHLSSLYELLSNIIRLTEYETDIFGERLCIDCSKNVDKLLEFGEKVLKNDFYLTSKFCDLYYSSTSNGTPTRLSSGEQLLLNLYSRLYEAMTLNPEKFANKSYASLILLDESELGFHPEWQRSFISLLVEFLDALKATNSTISDFQVLISTHSPILLSDIPKCCTNYLQRSQDGRTVKVEMGLETETFAANVFNLYRMSFFMEEGLVGKFAAKKINEILERIDNGDMQGVWENIQLVGDERIREFLLYKYQQNITQEDELIKYYERRVEQLKKGIKHE